MGIEEALVLLLKADAAVAALVAARVYPQAGYSDDVPPVVLYTTSDPERQLALNGYIDLYSVNVRFDCYGQAPAYASAKAVSAAVRACLFGFLRGNVTDGTHTVNVQGVFDAGGEDGLDPPVHGEERGVDYVGVSVEVWYKLNS